MEELIKALKKIDEIAHKSVTCIDVTPELEYMAGLFRIQEVVKQALKNYSEEEK